VSKKAFLSVFKDGKEIKNHQFDGEAMIGRSARDCQIFLDDRAISRKHAHLRFVANKLQIEKKSDFAPLNVNGIEKDKTVLLEGDKISIGPYIIQVSIQDDFKSKDSHNNEELPVDEDFGDLAPPGMDVSGSLPVEKELGSEASNKNENKKALLENENDSEDVDDSSKAPKIETESASESSISLAEKFLMEDKQESEEQSPGVAESENQHEEPGSVEKSGVEGFDFDKSEQSSLAEEEPSDGATRVISTQQLLVRLVFQPGSANVEVYDIAKEKVVIGRGKTCDIVLNDKKSSRENSLIQKSGLHYVIKDLGSSNGTYVNGVRVQEQELSGEDIIRIGGVEFEFKAENPNYADMEKDFLSVGKLEEGVISGHDIMSVDASPPMPGAAVGGGFGLDLTQDPGLAHTATKSLNIPGIDADGKSQKKKTLLQKFRELPPARRFIWGAVILFVFYYAFLDEDETAPKNTKDRKPAAVAKKDATEKVKTDRPSGALDEFAKLTIEQKRFVEAQHALAFDLYRNKEYDKALYELQKIFQLVSDYKDARELERYAREGKRKLEAFEEERRRKEEEQRLKEKIASLLREAHELMQKKKYEEAQPVFSEILSLDPENKEVSKWQDEIEEFNDEKQRLADEKRIQDEINMHAWSVYNEGLALKKQGKCYSAISVFKKVPNIESKDRRPANRSKGMIKACLQNIANQRDPILVEAKQLEETGEYVQAFDTYKKVTKIDPYHKAAYKGMGRIRDILHEKAKVFYTEAVLAESFSDFDFAKQKYGECLNVALKDDIYYGRATRKLERFNRTQGALE